MFALVMCSAAVAAGDNMPGWSPKDTKSGKITPFNGTFAQPAKEGEIQLPEMCDTKLNHAWLVIGYDITVTFHLRDSLMDEVALPCTSETDL